MARAGWRDRGAVQSHAVSFSTTSQAPDVCSEGDLLVVGFRRVQIGLKPVPAPKRTRASRTVQEFHPRPPSCLHRPATRGTRPPISFRFDHHHARFPGQMSIAPEDTRFQKSTTAHIVIFCKVNNFLVFHGQTGLVSSEIESKRGQTSSSHRHSPSSQLAPPTDRVGSGADHAFPGSIALSGNSPLLALLALLFVVVNCSPRGPLQVRGGILTGASGSERPTMPRKTASGRAGRESKAEAGGEPATKRAKLSKAGGASEEVGEGAVWRNFVLWLRETGFRWDDKVFFDSLPQPWGQPSGKTTVSSVNYHTNANRIGWHLWEINLRFATVLPPGWL